MITRSIKPVKLPSEEMYRKSGKRRWSLYLRDAVKGWCSRWKASVEEGVWGGRGEKVPWVHAAVKHDVLAAHRDLRGRTRLHFDRTRGGWVEHREEAAPACFSGVPNLTGSTSPVFLRCGLRVAG